MACERIVAIRRRSWYMFPASISLSQSSTSSPSPATSGSIPLLIARENAATKSPGSDISPRRIDAATLLVAAMLRRLTVMTRLPRTHDLIETSLSPSSAGSAAGPRRLINAPSSIWSHRGRVSDAISGAITTSGILVFLTAPERSDSPDCSKCSHRKSYCSRATEFPTASSRIFPLCDSRMKLFMTAVIETPLYSGFDSVITGCGSVEGESKLGGDRGFVAGSSPSTRPFRKLLRPLPKSPIISEMRPRPKRTNTITSTTSQWPTDKLPI